MRHFIKTYDFKMKLESKLTKRGSEQKLLSILKEKMGRIYSYIIYSIVK